ncbi:MAG: two-component system regulatory protein YycI [Gorillibacterium sp.]|nr:two-component system regulatory protein YycI [Gorillibacterium sp.]
MDWGRAKLVLIISFLLLNILLGYQLFNNRLDQISAADAAVIKEETFKRLESRDIRLSAQKVPKDTPKLKPINYTKKINHEDIQTIAEPVHASSLLRNKPSMKSLEKAGVINASAYRADPALSRKGELRVLHQIHEKLPMFDVELQLIEKDDKITGYKQVYVEVQSGVDTSNEATPPQEVISAYTALSSLVESSLPSHSVITDIRLGYYGQTFNSESLYMLPNWRIVLNSGDIYYVQAFNGAVQQKPAVKEQ